MPYVYKYIDKVDGIVKYVGIVWSENRTLLQRVKEHQMYDEWCNGKQWKIEYLEIDNKTDCEGLEGHFIALYGTSKWYNKGKVNWGISNIYSMVNWNWKEFDYIPEDIGIKKRNSRRINDSFLSNLYNKSIYIFNNGSHYCFFKTFKKEPICVYMASTSEYEEFAIENDIRYMNKEQLDSIIKMMEEDKKPFGWKEMLNEQEKMHLEDGLNIEKCFTYRRQKYLLEELSNDDMFRKLYDIKKYEKYFASQISHIVYTCCFSYEFLQKQKQGEKYNFDEKLSELF